MMLNLGQDELELLLRLESTITIPPTGCARSLDVDWEAAAELKAKIAKLREQQVRENATPYNKPKPSYAPTYAALYPALAEIARKHGYALAVHGSMQRDFDVIAVPWIENVGNPKDVVDEILQNFDVRVVGSVDTVWHGRQRWQLAIMGEFSVDLQFMPRACDWDRLLKTNDHD
jgi:hypothetical protein